jgi:dynein light chain LC8-type
MINESKNPTGETRGFKREPRKILILDTDMDDDMLAFVLKVVEDHFNIPKMSNQEMAKRLKEEFEAKYYPTWTAIVGKTFGVKINAQEKHYICFELENKTIILYKYH